MFGFRAHHSGYCFALFARSIEPGHGLSPRFLKEALDRQVAHDIKHGTLLERRIIGSAV